MNNLSGLDVFVGSYWCDRRLPTPHRVASDIPACVNPTPGDKTVVKLQSEVRRRAMQGITELGYTTVIEVLQRKEPVMSY
jgi:hypothetical protein